MPVFTRDNQTFDFTLTAADYVLLLKMLGFANAAAERLQFDDAQAFWGLSLELSTVKKADQ